MILGAGLLLLGGLALFVAGLLTGTTAFYWACVAACVAAAGLLVVAWRRIAALRSARADGDGPPVGAVPVPASSADEPPAQVAGSGAVPAEQEDPPVEEVEVTDLLLVVDLTDEVLVVDEHPRYHVAGCPWVGQRATIPLPMDEARTDGFTPCGACRPDRTMAERARARRSSASS